MKQHLAHRGIVTINSEVSDKQKEQNLERFMGDPKCRVMAAQFISGGKGLDGMQHVCHHVLFVEPCQQPRDFHQAVARLHRLGQRKRVMVMLATASGTVQVRGFRNLLANDALVNKVVPSMVDLRAEVYGG
jgi:SNF2 family DNA or RNA helicase